MLLTIRMGLGRNGSGSAEGFYLKAYDEYVRDPSKLDRKRWKRLAEEAEANNESLRKLMYARDTLKKKVKPKRVAKQVKKVARYKKPVVKVDTTAIENEIAALNKRIQAHIDARYKADLRAEAMRRMQEDDEVIELLLMVTI